MTPRGQDEDLIDISLRVPRSMVESAILAARREVGTGVRNRAMLARTIAAGRRRRAQILSGVRFGEPSWDMILELYLATCEGQNLDVTSLCQASGVPQTTALRHIEMLERQSLIRREPDQTDGRRISVLPHDNLRLQLDHWLDLEIAARDIAAL